MARLAADNHQFARNKSLSHLINFLKPGTEAFNSPLWFAVLTCHSHVWLEVNDLELFIGITCFTSNALEFRFRLLD